MSKKKAYYEVKKCKNCQHLFSEKSVQGNPYQYCPPCRERKIDEFKKLAKEMKNK
jgi:hypothetical protein